MFVKTNKDRFGDFFYLKKKSKDDKLSIFMQKTGSRQVPNKLLLIHGIQQFTKQKQNQPYVFINYCEKTL